LLSIPNLIFIPLNKNINQKRIINTSRRRPHGLTFGLKNIPGIFTPSLLLFGKFFPLTNYYPFKA